MNNEVLQSDVFKITNIISTKNPELVYKNKEGYRYNISKVKALYYNIVDDVINIRFNKEEILANIVNYILNDLVLLNHKISKPKLTQYQTWFESVKDSLDDDLLDDIRPERMMINHYNSDDKISDAIDVISNAIYKQKLLTSDALPVEFKAMFKYHKEYLETYKAERDVFEIGAATLNVKNIITVTFPEAYAKFVSMLKHVDVVTPNGIKLLWERYQDSYIINEPEIFWNYVQELVEDYDQLGYKLNELFISEDTLDIAEFNTTHSNYIRAKNKRFYDLQNQDAEHFKMTLGEIDEHDKETDLESMWG